MVVTDKLVLFYGWPDWPSNFHPFKFTMDGIEFINSEQAFMYLKAVHFRDKRSIRKILAARTALHCKILGRRVAGYSDDEWFPVRDDSMRKVTKAKYSRDSSIRTQLISTEGKLLVEASPSDRYWGAGMGEMNPGIRDPDKWPGLNRLGSIIMDERDAILNTLNRNT